MSVKKEWLAPLALLFVSFIWGATFVVVQNAMSFVGPFTFNGLRFLFAGIILLFVQMIFSQKTSKQDIKQSSFCRINCWILFMRWLFITNIRLTLYNFFKSRFLNRTKHCYGSNLIFYLF